MSVSNDNERIGRRLYLLKLDRLLLLKSKAIRVVESTVMITVTTACCIRNWYSRKRKRFLLLLNERFFGKMDCLPPYFLAPEDAPLLMSLCCVFD